MSHNNSISQVVSNYLLQIIEEQSQFLYSPENTRQPEIDEEEYEAPPMNEEEAFYIEESEPESEPESELEFEPESELESESESEPESNPESESESRPIHINRERRVLTNAEQQMIDTNYNNLQTEIDILERELFGFEEAGEAALIDGNGRDLGDEETFNGHIDFADFDEGSDVTLLSPSLLSISDVDNLLQSSSYIDIGALGPDDLNCVICHSEYSKERERENNSSEPAVEERNQDSPGQKTAECPIKLPCGHVFGHLCIRTWLRNSQSPSCPICRYELLA